MTYEKLKAVIEVIKKRFNNLNAIEMIDIASDILQALEKHPTCIVCGCSMPEKKQ